MCTYYMALCHVYYVWSPSQQMDVVTSRPLASSLCMRAHVNSQVVSKCGAADKSQEAAQAHVFALQLFPLCLSVSRANCYNVLHLKIHTQPCPGF